MKTMKKEPYRLFFLHKFHDPELKHIFSGVTNFVVGNMNGITAESVFITGKHLKIITQTITEYNGFRRVDWVDSNIARCSPTFRGGISDILDRTNHGTAVLQ